MEFVSAYPRKYRMNTDPIADMLTRIRNAQYAKYHFLPIQIVSWTLAHEPQSVKNFRFMQRSKPTSPGRRFDIVRNNFIYSRFKPVYTPFEYDRLIVPNFYTKRLIGRKFKERLFQNQSRMINGQGRYFKSFI